MTELYVSDPTGLIFLAKRKWRAHVPVQTAAIALAIGLFIRLMKKTQIKAASPAA